MRVFSDQERDKGALFFRHNLSGDGDAGASIGRGMSETQSAKSHSSARRGTREGNGRAYPNELQRAAVHDRTQLIVPRFGVHLTQVHCTLLHDAGRQGHLRRHPVDPIARVARQAVAPIL